MCGGGGFVDWGVATEGKQEEGVEGGRALWGRGRRGMVCCGASYNLLPCIHLEPSDLIIVIIIQFPRRVLPTL